jgi:hypothetical protein
MVPVAGTGDNDFFPSIAPLKLVLSGSLTAFDEYRATGGKVESREKPEEVFQEFRRINFFKGFFTEAEDWQLAQQYHIDKRRLHNTSLHTPGIVFGYSQSLRVWTGPDGAEIHIDPGCAIDGQGFELYLKDVVSLPVDPTGYQTPTTLYVALSHGEEESSRRKSYLDPDTTVNAFWDEKPKAFLTEIAPDNFEVIELARINLSAEAEKIADAEDPDRPQENEIDLRYVKKAGARTQMSLADVSVEVKVGQTNVEMSVDKLPSENDTNVLIERIDQGDLERFYVVNAYPLGKARIVWRVESESDGNVVEYRLYFKNFSANSVKVAYRVLRLR